MSKRIPIFVGRKYTNTIGLEYVVSKLIDKKWCEVTFTETNTTITASRANLSSGKIKDPNHFYGLGRLGVGEYLLEERILWKNMLHRVENHPAYKDSSVCDRWLTLSNFVEDIRAMENYSSWLSDTSEWHLDKDTKYVGNRIYSKQNCRFIPAFVNQSAEKRDLGLKTYIATHEDGSIVEFTKQRRFAKDYGLCYKNLNRSITKGGTTKGWTIKVAE